MRVFVVNAGSTSVKLRMIEDDDRVSAAVDLDATGTALPDELDRFLTEFGPADATGHRVVHGGPLTRPTVVDDGVRRVLDEVANLAPLHDPPALAAIDALRSLRPGVPAVACFDTAFHTTIGPEAATYALPVAWTERWGLRRYGFHGLSCEWATGRASALLGRAVDELRLVICHLGGGASVTAVAGGRSVDTTMGFTPTEGLVMATRPGDVDPGAIAWIVGHGVSPEELADALERRSGLLALSGGRTGDMRSLLEGRSAGDPQASLAVAVYVHRLKAKIASMFAATDGADALVFTAGVGERATELRAEVCRRLDWLGVAIDEQVNSSVDTDDVDVSRRQSSVRTLVVHAREELVVAAACRALLGDDHRPL